jgi:HSP20 family protein
MVKKALSRLTNHVSDEELFFGGSDIETATNDWFAQSDSEGQLAVDVYQTPTEIVVKAPVAGVAGEDINITVKADSVTISGERKEEKEVTSDGYLARECFWGSFSRIVSLPTEGEPEKAKATFKNGILTIRIPKSKKEHEVTLKVSS